MSVNEVVDRSGFEPLTSARTRFRALRSDICAPHLLPSGSHGGVGSCKGARQISASYFTTSLLTPTLLCLLPARSVA